MKIKNVFSTLDKGSKFYDIDRELRETKEQLELINNADVSELTGKLKKLGEIAEDEFKTFLNLYNLSGSSYKFYDIFEGIRSGAITSQQAIERVKNEFDYLLVEAKSSGNQHYDILNSSAIREMVENISTLRIKVDEIMTKISNISGEKTRVKIFDEEQFSRLLILFEKIESSLSSMKAVFVDVGDGEEFSPLLKMINDVRESVGKLSSSAKNIGLNMNIEVGSNKELETKFQEKASKALIAYQRLFDHIKSTASSQSVFEAFNKFNLDDFDTTYGKAKAIADFIERARNDSKLLYNGHDVLKEDTTATYWNQASAAMGQTTKVLKEMKASSNTNTLENLFGKTDLTEVITQLNRIVEKLSEISSTASEFKNAFANGFNVSASVEEIEKLTSRVKELEDELSKVKVSSASPVKTNISSPMKDTFQGDKIQEATTSARELDRTLEGVEIPKEAFDDALSQLDLTKSKLKEIVRITKDWNNGAESFTLKDKYGSTEIYGRNSNTEKGQLLRSHYVQYDAKQAKDEAKALEQAVKQAQKLAEEKRKARQADKQATQSSVDKALKNQLDAWEAIQKIRLQITQTDSKDTTKLQNLKTQKKERQEDFIQAQKVLKANEELYDKESQLAKLELERLETNEKINKFKLNNVDVGSVLSKGDSDLKKFEAKKNQSEEYRGTVEKLKQSIEELRVLEQSMVKSKLLPNVEAQKINEAVASIEEYTNAIKNMPAGEKGSDALSRDKWANRIREYMDKNTRLTREFREELENLIRILRTGGDSVVLKDVIGQFEDAKFRIKEAKLEGISFFDIFKNKAIYGFAARLAQYYLSFYDFIRYARYAVQSVIEFDTALTEMRKVSDESVSTLERLQKATFDLADGVGTTALELQKSIADFMRIGETLEDATKSAQDANVLFRVSEFDDVTQATDALVAMSAAYKDLEKSQINDVLNEIGNNYAISTDELASALQKSAATLSVAGNDIYEAAALVTAGNTVLQDADSVGTGLKMISLRILGTQEAKDELASLGENVDDFVVQTKSKIDQTVRNYTAVTSNGFKGISVLDDNGNYRSTYEILRDISDVYQEIIETDKKAGTNRGQALLEVLAGKNRSNVAASILQSPEILESAYESALNSAGSAQEELNKYLESADGKVQKLKNKLQEFWNVLLDSGTLKTIIGSLTTILEKATELVDTFGTLGTAGLGLGAFLGIKNIGREKCYPSSNMPIVI